jgi:Zn-dependent peptidase ImmA (M78 family)
MENLNIQELLKSVFSDKTEFDIKEQFDKKIEEYNLSKTKALKFLNIDKDVFEEIINGSAKQPNLIHIVKLAEFLERDINEFISVVLRNQSPENIASIASARKTTFVLKHFDMKTLTKEGFFHANDDIDSMVGKVLDFFGFSSIAEYEEQLDEPLYSRVRKRLFSDKMKDFWVKSAYQTFRCINNPNEYDRERLKDLVPKIKPYTENIKDGLLIVCKALYSLGVTVIFQNYLSTTQVRGATFIVNGRPCIVLTDYLKKYPTIWFTLLHELHHVLFDFQEIERNNFHLSGDSDLFLTEEKADSFAREYFMPEDNFHYIKRIINNPYMVSRFARENEMEISLVYSFFTWYQQELYGKNYHAAFKEFYPDYTNAVEKLNPLKWNDVNIKAISSKIKNVLELN